MSSVEFQEWRAFQRLEGPLGPVREDWRFAMVAATFVNVMRDRKRSREVEPKDFVPDWEASWSATRRTRTPADVADKVKGYFQALARKAGGRQ